MTEDKRAMDDDDDTDDMPAEKERGSKSREAPDAKLDDFIAAAHRLAILAADSKVFPEHGVTIDDWSVLKAVGGERDAAIGDVAKRAGMARPRLRTLLLDLEGKGLVAVKQEGDDKRALMITMTPKAADAVTAIAGAFDAVAQTNPSLAKATGKRLGSGARLAARLASVIQRAESPAKKGEGGRRRGKAEEAVDTFDDADMDDD